jgi:hypothetical protein
MGLFGTKESSEAKRELAAAKREYEKALAARKWSLGVIRASIAEISDDGIIAKHGRVVLRADRVVTPSGTFMLSPEVSAAVDTAGAISSRVTATRLVLTGPFALAMKKKKDERELFLYVDAPTGQHVEPCKPEEQAKVRAFAAQITSTARRFKPGVDKDTRIAELYERRRALDAPDSAVRLALAELRAIEDRLREEGRLPAKYKADPDPAPLT